MQSESFLNRDEEEVAGYAYVMELVFAHYADMPLSEGILFQIHRDLLRHSSKDERHRGDYKTLPNHVAAFDADGRELGIVFATTSPFETAKILDASPNTLKGKFRELISADMIERHGKGRGAFYGRKLRGGNHAVLRAFNPEASQKVARG